MRAGASTTALKTAAAALAASVRELIREAATFDADLRRKIEQFVLDMSDERIAFDRSWYLPLGFDPAPGEVSPMPKQGTLANWQIPSGGDKKA